MTPSPRPLNSTLSQHPNNTYYFDDDLEDTGYTELQIAKLACLLTALPLTFALISYLCIRYCWAKYRRAAEPAEFGKTIDKEASERNKSSHALLPDQMKPTDSQFSVFPVEEMEEGLTSYSSGNQTSKSTANGSIITMTMKNNHLIVETEETLADSAGEVFVVDVEPTPASEAIVHQAEADAALPVDDDYVGVGTGLSTSDLSVSSDDVVNRGYSYGTQQEYRVDTESENDLLGCPLKGAEDDEVHLEQQRRLGGQPPRQTLPLEGHYENPAYVPTPAEPQPLSAPT